MANAQIQSTIQLGLAETGIGNSLIGEGLGAGNAANQALAVATARRRSMRTRPIAVL